MQKRSSAFWLIGKSLSLFLLLVFLFLTQHRALPCASAAPAVVKNNKGPGGVRVEPWYLGFSAACSLTFDDNPAAKQENLSAMLEKAGFRGTFFVNPDPICEFIPCPHHSPPDWDRFLKMAKDGHEIAAHTAHHLNLTKLANYSDEMSESQRLIQKELANAENRSSNPLLHHHHDSSSSSPNDLSWIHKQVGLTIAYPYGEYNSNTLAAVTDFFLSGRTINLGHIVPQPDTQDVIQVHELLAQVPSLLWRRDTSGKDANKKISNTIRLGGWLTECSHGIDEVGWESPKKEEFEKHLKYLRRKAKEGKVWVDTVLNISKYLLQRAASRITVLSRDRSGAKTQVGFWLGPELLGQLRSIKGTFLPEEHFDPVPMSISVRLPHQKMHSGCLQEIKVSVDGEPIPVVDPSSSSSSSVVDDDDDNEATQQPTSFKPFAKVLMKRSSIIVNLIPKKPTTTTTSTWDTKEHMSIIDVILPETC